MTPMSTSAPPTAPPAMAPTFVFLPGDRELAVGATVVDVVGSVLPLIRDRDWAVYRRANNLGRSSVAQGPLGVVIEA
jgi:hypothetical protein